MAFCGRSGRRAAILEVLTKAGVKIHEVTWADYQQHKAEYDATGDVYKITNSGIANMAENVSYKNTNVASELDSINSNLSVQSIAYTNESGRTLDFISVKRSGNTCIVTGAFASGSNVFTKLLSLTGVVADGRHYGTAYLTDGDANHAGWRSIYIDNNSNEIKFAEFNSSANYIVCFEIEFFCK